MHLRTGFWAAAVATAVAGCSDSSGPTAPLTDPALSVAKVTSNPTVRMEDDCDPLSFNAAIGAGTCTVQGGTTFQQFVAELTATRVAAAWRFNPDALTLKIGSTITATNNGGEVHTFTEVKKFGGGIVTLLNQLSHLDRVAPECNALDAEDFVPPGGTYVEDIDTPGLHRFQCCIHPWMQAIVHVNSAGGRSH
jgi:plastocyanin